MKFPNALAASAGVPSPTCPKNAWISPTQHTRLEASLACYVLVSSWLSTYPAAAVERRVAAKIVEIERERREQHRCRTGELRRYSPRKLRRALATMAARDQEGTT